MAINFPNNPTVGQIYSFGGYSWQWNGSYWESYSTSIGYLPLSGGTVTGFTIFNSGVDINSLTAFTSVFDNITVNTQADLNGLDVQGVSYFHDVVTIYSNLDVSGTIYTNTISATTYLNYPDSYVTGFTSQGNQLTLSQNRNDIYSSLTLTLTGITATTSVTQGITGITGTSGVSAVTNNFGTTIINTNPDKTVVITGGTGIQIVSNYPNFGINYTGSTGISGDYLPLSGGTVTGGTIFTNGLTANTVSATTYYNLPVSGLTEGNGISITNNNGNFTITSTATTSNVVQGITGITGTSGVSAITTNYGTTIINTDPDKTVIITGGTGIQIVSNYPNFGINFTGSTTGGTVIGDYLPLSGGTVTGNTTFTSGLTANTISATIYYNLPKDIFVTGGTYANGTATFVNNTGGTFNVIGFPTATGTTTNYYGSFSDTRNQTVNGVNTPTSWSANTTELSNGIYIVDGSKITVSNDGIYEIGYSAQIEKTQGTAAPVTIWAKLNGNNIDRSSSTITLENNSVYALPFVSYIFDLYAGDYIEFYFSSPSQHVQITTLSGLTSPTRPVSPSLILVAKAIGNAVLSNSGDSYVTGFTLTNNNLTLNQNRVGQYSGFSVNLPYLNTSGGTINGDLNVTGSVTASTYYGYGGYLTGISRGGGGGAGGQLYYFNISNTQSPYYEFSTTATTASEQSISATTGASQTAYVGGFMTPVGVPGITNFPAGILSFYLHCYDGANHNFNVYCELYKRTTGGSETLLFTSDPVAVVGTTTEMVISDGFFSGSTLDITDRLVVKIYATNISNQTRTFYFVSEGSQHYSFALTTIPAFTDTYVTGFTYSNNTFTIKQNNSQPDLTQTINTMTGLTVNGNLTATTIVTTYLNSWYVRDNTGIVAIDVNNRRLTKSNGSTIVFDWENGVLTGLTNLQSSSISATTYQNLPVSAVTNGNGISASTSNGVVTITNTQVQGITGKTDGAGISSSISNNVISITNTDLGSSQNIFKNIQVGGVTQFSAGSNSSNLNFSGINISIVSAATNTLVFSAGTGGSNTSQGITGITATDGLSGNTSSFATTIINIDKGSTQNIFKNIQVGGIFQFSANTNNSDLNFSGVGLTITSGINNTLVFSASPGGVTSITVGSGLSGNSTTGAVTLINTQVQGITGITSGAGITATTNNNVTTITNLGVTGITAGYGISASTTTGAVTIIQKFDYGKSYTTGNNLNFI